MRLIDAIQANNLSGFQPKVNALRALWFVRS
jgi:hypothetical protein